jgi:hypothetical protein
MENIKIAQKYFEVSNISDFDQICELFSETSTYSSQNTGLYLWTHDIIEMQKWFHASFENLNWEIKEIQEEKAGIIKVDFIFTGVRQWEKIEFSWIEYLVIINWIIQHIEIKNK